MLPIQKVSKTHKTNYTNFLCHIATILRHETNYMTEFELLEVPKNILMLPVLYASI